MTRPLADRDSAEWWAALADHRLQIQTCQSCRTHRLVARAMCAACRSFDWEWTEASGEGTIVSWTVSHRAYQPERTAPYTVVIVRLAEGEGLLLPGGWSSDAAPSMGMPVRAEFEDVPGEPPAALLRWEPVTD
ncbi:Zn-ribbon domain-containing OB-fold protein [Amycolatopsis silviterrae]|uniref:Zn-ribbon domain-containing OB-fold protein n=1 Tax=Amycolatopsis silviterrae TaxID=1656914 RepID=A0ABW5H6V5_9PSEU